VFNKGRLEQVGTPMALYQGPGSVFVAQFLGSPRMNIMPATVNHDVAHVLGAAWPIASTAQAPSGAAPTAWLGVRPDALQINASAAPSPDSLSGVLEAVEALGDTCLHVVRVSGLAEPLVCKADLAVAQPGQPVQLRAKPDAVHLFDADQRRTNPPLSNT
jgi:ABC-type sugar transport system ATPase subunit